MKSGVFFRPFYTLFLSIILISLFVCLFAPLIIQADTLEKYTNLDTITISSKGYAWPSPGYTRINSYFGKRTSPTAGASSYHKGIDIGAPEGSYLIAVQDGEITFTGFLGGGGYTITLTIENGLKITYCHISPIFLVEEGQIVKRGEIIGRVGPKYIEPIQGNTYTDETGKQTNGATTGAHLHLGVRTESNNYINPLELFKEN